MPSSPPCERVPIGRLRLLAESYRRLTGKPLPGNILPVGAASAANIAFSSSAFAAEAAPADDEALHAALWSAPFAIVAHGTEADPIFFYGNRYALRSFEMDFDEFARLPSRLSAEPLNQEAREQALRKVSAQGYIDGYSGMRIASSGRRFMITDCTIWNLVDADGVAHGQAAIFVEQQA